MILHILYEVCIQTAPCHNTSTSLSPRKLGYFWVFTTLYSYYTTRNKHFFQNPECFSHAQKNKFQVLFAFGFGMVSVWFLFRVHTIPHTQLAKYFCSRSWSFRNNFTLDYLKHKYEQYLAYTSIIFGCSRMFNMAHTQEARCPPGKLDSPTASEKSSLVLLTINISQRQPEQVFLHLFGNIPGVATRYLTFQQSPVEKMVLICRQQIQKKRQHIGFSNRAAFRFITDF